jgi:hypothetical protein
MGGASGVTVGEAIGLLRRLEPRAAADLTERKLRYISAMLGLTSGRQGATAMLNRLDLAVIRLLIRLEAEGLSQPIARFVTVCLAPEIRTLLSAWKPVSAVVAVQRLDVYPKLRRPILTSAADAERLGIYGVTVPVRDLMAGLTEGIARVRTAQPTVWQWKQVEPSTAVTRVQECQREAVLA